MTPDSLPAGPELDRLVAERVMGWTDCRKMAGCDWYSFAVPFRTDRCLVGSDSARGFAPSTNIAHAWEVVEHLHRQAICFQLTEYRDGRWGVIVVRLYPPGSEEDERGLWQELALSDAVSAPLGICRAALKAVS